jgi:ribosome-associated protein
MFINDKIDIPEHEIWFEFSHSRGPGGQNVNKVSSRVTLCFAVSGSGALTSAQKGRAEKRLRNRISADGVLRITADEERSQLRNRQLACERFAALLAQALTVRKKRVPTKPTRASNGKRLREKKARSHLKQDRNFLFED